MHTRTPPPFLFVVVALCLDDALSAFGAGLAASVTAGTQIKVEFLDTFKSKPPLPGVRRNDIAMLVSFVYKFE